MTQSVYATCVAIEGKAVLFVGRSGSGKSDLALRLIDRGAELVSDDYVTLAVEAGRLTASPPETIQGKIEVRGLGIINLPFVRSVPVSLVVDLEALPDRLPMDALTTEFLGVTLALIRLQAHDASAPIKVEIAVKNGAKCL